MEFFQKESTVEGCGWILLMHFLGLFSTEIISTPGVICRLYTAEQHKLYIQLKFKISICISSDTSDVACKKSVVQNIQAATQMQYM